MPPPQQLVSLCIGTAFEKAELAAQFDRFSASSPSERARQHFALNRNFIGDPGAEAKSLRSGTSGPQLGLRIQRGSMHHTSLDEDTLVVFEAGSEPSFSRSEGNAPTAFGSLWQIAVLLR